MKEVRGALRARAGLAVSMGLTAAACLAQPMAGMKNIQLWPRM